MSLVFRSRFLNTINNNRTDRSVELGQPAFSYPIMVLNKTVYFEGCNYGGDS